MFTAGTAIGLFAFVAVMLVVAYFIQRLDSAILGKDEVATADPGVASDIEQAAQAAPKPADRATKHRRHGR